MKTLEVSSNVLIALIGVSCAFRRGAANVGLNYTGGLCVNSAHRPNSTEHFPLSVDDIFAL